MPPPGPTDPAPTNTGSPAPDAGPDPDPDSGPDPDPDSGPDPDPDSGPDPDPDSGPDPDPDSGPGPEAAPATGSGPAPGSGPDAAAIAPQRWPVGALVLWRFRRHGKVSHVQTARVADDGPDWLALYWAEGYPRIESIMADGRRTKQTPAPDRYLLPRVRRRTRWSGAGSRVLCMVPRPSGPAVAATGPGSLPAYSIWLMWNADQPACYYINLEAPHRFWQHGDLRGVDTEDHELDLVITPDRTTWRLKDEPEFELATGLPGYWSAAEADAIRAAGQAALALVLSGVPTLDNWSYRPTSSWTIPEIPTNWDRGP
jgi:Protein of unknown function (DUF402)